ncbi:SHE10 [Symbiodinium sp. CCMP2592]|nr:SHE10 [Symbiodinium sp. CCMP2592]
MATSGDAACCSSPRGSPVAMARLVLTDGTKRLSKEVTECANCKSYLYQGEETLRRQVKLEKIGPHDYRLPRLPETTPIGLQISRACDQLYHFLVTPGSGNADALLQHWQKMAREPNASALLKQSIFALLEPEDIKEFLLSPDNRLWHTILDRTERFLQLLEAEGEPVLWSADEMTPAARNTHLECFKPVVMDHSIREPATNTPFGHSGYMKYLTLKIVQAMGMKDIAIAGLYYKDSYTPETQILEELHDRKEPMDGLIAMFGPGEEDRVAGLEAIKRFKVPNAFLDLTLKASVRFQQSDFVQSVLDAVRELDEIFTVNFGSNPYRTAEDKGMGEVSVNLVDLMEFLELRTDGSMEASKQQQAESAFAVWRQDPTFRRRVVAILTEEGRGCANHLDYAYLVRWLRRHFPDTRILVHAHAGRGNTQDAASVEAVLNGGNGVWAAVIPQAAQGGHNSSVVFLDNLLALGCRQVLNDFWLHQAAQCARHIYFLNFNTFRVPDDCPIWGRRVNQLLHTAFSTVSGEEWRRRRTDYYNVWSKRAQVEFEEYAKLPEQSCVSETRARNESFGNYRISPLVSDVETWRHRIAELRVLGGKERVGDYVNELRNLAFALMNANIRANFDECVTLQRLADVVRRARRRNPAGNIHGFEKARQHQGDTE